MVEQVLIGTVVMGAMVFVASAAVAVVAVRRVRRACRSAQARWRALRTPRTGRRGALQPTGSVALATLGSPGWWAVQHRRHRMWRAVSSAQHAVGVARRSGVPVGDLPALASRLTAAAGGVDSVLRASARLGPLRDEDRDDCDRITAAAASVQDAALFSLRCASHTEVEPVVSAVRIEAAALAAGVRAALR
jgi:hypothetical protein